MSDPTDARSTPDDDALAAVTGEPAPADTPVVDGGEVAPPATGGPAEHVQTDGDPTPPDGADPRDEGPASRAPTPLDEIVAERPVEAILPMRSPLALAGTAVVGGLMGVAEVVPGFSGGTVAFVAGIYERLVATIRQGARTLSLLVRGRVDDAWRAFMVIEWPFVAALSLGMLTAVFAVASTMERLLAERPLEMQAIFLGLVLGAAVLAARQLRRSSPWNVLAGVAAAAAFFVLLGFGGGEIADPNPLWFVIGGAVAVSAWILPGVSGSFLLLLLGLYTGVLGAVSDRQVGALLLFAVGCVIGLAISSTALNWLLARAHDLVVSVLIGLMIASGRVLWPWPNDGQIGNPTLGAPQGAEIFLVAALVLGAFGSVWIVGLFGFAVDRRRQAWRERRAVAARQQARQQEG
ncbi:MAG: DUF368 domain-containing protein [Nitriliruptoraceae bacterium]|nr:DUF368 domain-containing protein [Nitriliruptoraceae bacterium]